MSFLPIPAVDVHGGRVVRLHRGDYAQVTEYRDDPLPLLSEYVAAGAERIHLVDLDGARSGTIDLDLVTEVAAIVPDLQVGGGIRSTAAAEGVLRAGASRVVVGSLAIHQPDELVSIVKTIGAEHVVIAVDVREGRARGRGWRDEGAAYAPVVRRAVGLAVGSLLVTGIDRDGTLDGPDLELVSSVRALAPGVEIIASGGVADLTDLDRARDAGADAAVVGRALLDGRFTVDEMLDRFTLE